MAEVVAIYGSPRRKGNTSTLLDHAVSGVQEAGLEVKRFYLRDLTVSPCLEIYRCKKDGECAIGDDFQVVRDAVLEAKGLLLASPIFFYSVSAQTKALMDRFQSQWVKKYWIDGAEFGKWTPKRKGLFISAGATKGKRLFEGTLFTVRYFFDTLDMELWKSLLYRGLDREQDALSHPEYLQEAKTAGRDFAAALSQG